MPSYTTTFCNKAHDTVDGKPINHNCMILNVQALALEMAGDWAGANALGIVQEPRREMARGKRAPLPVPGRNSTTPAARPRTGIWRAP